MAVTNTVVANKKQGGGRKVLVGLNVALMVGLAVVLVGVLQVVANQANRRWDMTSSAINSLSEGTEKLLCGLPSNVKLTSLYFKTDLEDEDQKKYRDRVGDLLALYESVNRSRVSWEWVNPLSDHEKLSGLMARLREKSAYKEGIEKYKELLTRFQKDIGGQISTLLSTETESIKSFASGGMGGGSADRILPGVEELLLRLTSNFETTGQAVGESIQGDNPQYSAASNDVKRLYRSFADALKKYTDFGSGEAQRGGDLPKDLADHLRNVGARTAPLVQLLEEELKKFEGLEPLKLDEIVREIRPNSNSLLVETDEQAMLVDFATLWPPVDPNETGMVRFDRRAFRGEQSLTSAILRITHKDQTAVVFVRFGGAPLLGGGGMPGMGGGGPYQQMARHLEDTNFVVDEWDLKTSMTPPEITPAPKRTVFVVLQPNPPDQNPMARQQPPDQGFTDKHRQALLQAMGDNGRAIFIAGWEPAPPPMPGMPPTGADYEYGEYLRTNWGINVEKDLLIQFASMSPGKYGIARQGWYFMDDLDVGSHDVVRSLQTMRTALPWCAPLGLVDPKPEGVTLHKLFTQPFKDGVWAIKQINKYQEQQKAREYLTREPEDREGPFELAFAAEKGNSKIVVVNSREFAEDPVAMARMPVLSAEGLSVRTVHPGNVTFFTNALHWLNDNTEFMNIGKPVEAAVLEVKPSDVRKVQIATIVVWPAMALAFGGVMWRLRRR